MHSRDSMTIYICMDGGIDGRGWKEGINNNSNYCGESFELNNFIIT